MIDTLPLHDPPQLQQPLDRIEEVRRRRRNRVTSAKPWIIGAIIFLDGGTTPCRIVALEPEPLCVPVQE
jgi:hypothetical protein